MADLTSIAPPKDLDNAGRLVVFEYISRRLASHRNSAYLFADAERAGTLSSEDHVRLYKNALDHWVQDLLQQVWIACQEPGGGDPHKNSYRVHKLPISHTISYLGSAPTLGPLADTSTANLPSLPPEAQITQILHTTLFLHITTTKSYHAHTRAFLVSLRIPVDECAIAATLKHPDRALEEAQRKTEEAREEQAASGRALRVVGMGLGAVAGGLIVGITGGLAAPLVGAGMSTVLGWLGVGGTAAGLMASGLAGSSVVCGALFGAYGSKKSAEMMGRLTREVRDLAILPVKDTRETLAMRLCVSGWLGERDDVTAPWRVFGGDKDDADTFALQWVSWHYD